MIIDTYIDEEDRCHDPSEVVREDLQERLEHALVVDDMPEKFFPFFFTHFLAVFQSHHNGVLLAPVSLQVDIVGKSHFFVLEYIVRLLCLDEQISRVDVRVLVRVIL